MPGRNGTVVVPTAEPPPVCVKSMMYVSEPLLIVLIRSRSTACLENGGAHATLGSAASGIGDVIAPGEGGPARPPKVVEERDRVAIASTNGRKAQTHYRACQKAGAGGKVVPELTLLLNARIIGDGIG